MNMPKLPKMVKKLTRNVPALSQDDLDLMEEQATHMNRVAKAAGAHHRAGRRVYSAPVMR